MVQLRRTPSIRHRQRRKLGLALFLLLAAVPLVVCAAQDPPAIAFFTPTGGPAGTLVSMRADALDFAAPGNNQVSVNGVQATIEQVFPTEVFFRIPDGATTGPIALTTPGGTATSAILFVVSPISISIEPGKAAALVQRPKSFSALVTGTSNAGVRWFVNDVESGNQALGTITQLSPAVYTAPAQVPAPDTVLVTAVSVADPNVKAIAPVRVFSLSSVPDLDLPPADFSSFSLNPDVGIETSRTRILVMMNEGVTSCESLASALADHSAGVIGGLPELGMLMVEIPDSDGYDASDAAIAALKQAAGVEEAVPDSILYANTVSPREGGPVHFWYQTAAGWTIDYLLAHENWAWEVAPYGRNWGIEYSNFPQAWNWYFFVTHGQNRIINVAIMDVGNVLNVHRDFWDDGIIMLNPGQDYHYHSTHVAGIVAAKWNDKLGICGTTPFAHLVSAPTLISAAATPALGERTIFGQMMLDTFRQFLRHTNYLHIPVVNMSMGYNWYRQLGEWRDANHNHVFDDGEWRSSFQWHLLPGALPVPPNVIPRMALDMPRGMPQTEQRERDFVAAQGVIARRMVNWANGAYDPGPLPQRPSLVFVAAAGNDRGAVYDGMQAQINQWGFVNNVAADAVAQEKWDSWGAENFSAEFSSPFTWAAYNGARNVLVVEALKPRGDRDLVERADFSCRAVVTGTGDHNHPGTVMDYGVSAPGVDICSTTARDNPPGSGTYDPIAYENLNGTSMAAPHVTGLAAYLHAIGRTIRTGAGTEPYFTNDEIIRLIRNSGRVSANAAPVIDAYAACLRIDELPNANKIMKRALLNIDDGTMDGNDFSVAHTSDHHGTVNDDGDGVIHANEITIDMKDFRRFRDAYLQVTGRDDALVHPEPGVDYTDNLKRDLNEDGVVDTQMTPIVKEDVYARCDFDGDGHIHVFQAQNDLAMMEDPDIWDDPDVTADMVRNGILRELMSSGDIKIDASDCFTGDVDKIKIFARYLDSSGQRVDEHFITILPTNVLDTVTGEDRRKVFTVPANKQFILLGRAYSGTDYRRVVAPITYGTHTIVREGENILRKFKPVEVVSLPFAFTADTESTVAFDLVFRFLGAKGPEDVLDLDINSTDFAVTWTVPPGAGTVVASGSGWTYTATGTPGLITLQADVQWDGESVNPSDKPLTQADVTVRNAVVKSPGGLCVDSAGNLYVSDAEDGTIVMVPPNRKGFVLLDGLTRPGDTELGPNGRTLVVAESDAKIEKFVFGVSGQVKDTDGNLLVGATITGTTPISGTPGTGDTVSQRRTDAGGWFHLFNLLTPPTGSDTVDALITIEYQGKSQAYEVKLGPDGQKVQDFTFGATRLTLNVSGEGTVTPPAGVHDYLRNASVTLQATPAEGWRFMRWTGDLESAQNPLDIVMSSDTVVTAVFDRP